MPKYHIVLDTEGAEEDVEAAYSVLEDGFVTFKDSEHKQVATFNANRLVSAIRTDVRPTSIGSVIVNVVPQVDDQKFAEAIEAAVERYTKRTGRTKSEFLG